MCACMYAMHHLLLLLTLLLLLLPLPEQACTACGVGPCYWWRSTQEGTGQACKEVNPVSLQWRSLKKLIIKGLGM